MASGHGVSHLLPYAVNFSVVVGIAVYFGRKPLQKFVYQRHERLKDLIDSAAVAKEKAEKRLSSVTTRLNSLPQELEKIQSDRRLETQRDIEELKTKTTNEVQRLSSDLENSINNERAQQKNKVKKRFLNLTITKTKETLNNELKQEDHSNLVEKAKSRLGATQ